MPQGQLIEAGHTFTGIGYAGWLSLCQGLTENGVSKAAIRRAFTLRSRLLFLADYLTARA